jgi:S-DNA-T family DNA segregation ATPase FtsK/SpoIIIE
MATENKRKSASKELKRQLSIETLLRDERMPKLVGLLLLLFSFYAFVAFTSYLFTYSEDYDWVDDFHFDMLFGSEVEAANWLGVLGAMVAHFFIYNLFGIPSFIFVYLFFGAGLYMIKSIPLQRLLPRFWWSLFTMVWTSALLAFVFNHTGLSSFLWGGTIGLAIVNWMYNILGTLGILALLVFCFFAIVVWRYNPSFENLDPEKIQGYFADFFRWESLRNVFVGAPKTDLSAADGGVSAAERSEPKAQSAKPSVPPQRPLPGPAQTKSGADPGGETQLDFDIPPTSRFPSPSLSAAGKGPDEMEVVEPSRSDIEAVMNEEAGRSRILSAPAPAPPPADGEEEEAEPYESLGPYDPTLDLPSFENPVLSLLEAYDDQQIVVDREELEQNKNQIVNTLLHYKIEITRIKATVGPTVTLYEIVPSPGVRTSKIKNLEDDIALSLAALGIRIIAPIPGKGTIGIEVPNRNKQVVALRELLASEKFRRSNMELPIALGKSINNEVFVVDLTKMPHLLVAGATGQGKSVGINSILMSLLYKKHPAQIKLVLIDPKKVELSPYNRIDHHYLAFLPGDDEPIVTDTSKVVQTLHSLTLEMDERYNLLKKANVRHLTEYNTKFVARRLNPNKGHRYLPYIILVVDEFADLIMTAGKEVELPLGRLAQLARAVGIHLIIATQRPSVNIITGVIKANFPARLAFKVTSKIDSRTILDSGGAEQLTGRGDMLLSLGGEITRLQCAFVDTPEVERVIEFIGNQKGYPEPFYLPEAGFDGERTDASTQKVVEELDEFFEDSARLVVMNQSGSTSMIQRRLKLGYNRAGRIMDQLEALGIVGAADGSKPREVLFNDEVELEKYLRSLRQNS